MNNIHSSAVSKGSRLTMIFELYRLTKQMPQHVSI